MFRGVKATNINTSGQDLGTVVGKKFTGMIDGHAHIFLRSLAMCPDRRYTPDDDAPVRDYVKTLRTSGLEGGILVQPSFLGTDNSYLLDALAAARPMPGQPRLWGVVAVNPTVQLATLRTHRDVGVVGARLNLLGRAELPDLHSATWQRFFMRLNDLDWHLELHIEGPRLVDVLDVLRGSCRKVVVDHFGLPRVTGAGPAIETLTGARPGGLWVKATAPYRVWPDLPMTNAIENCAGLYHRLADALGGDALIWGSDWPWTQNVYGQSFADTLAWREIWRAGVAESAGGWAEALLPDTGEAPVAAVDPPPVSKHLPDRTAAE